MKFQPELEAGTPHFFVIPQEILDEISLARTYERLSQDVFDKAEVC